MVAYRFEDSRATECVARHLSGYRGILQVDGYGGYSKLVRKDGGNDGVVLAGCWSHSRRKFYELHVAKSSKVATETVERMAELWEIEETVRGQNPHARVAGRQERSATIVRDLFKTSSSAFSPTGASRLTPTLLSGRSDPRPSSGRTASSQAATAVAGHGRQSRRCCKRLK
jgi:hypothetical protein